MYEELLKTLAPSEVHIVGWCISLREFLGKGNKMLYEKKLGDIWDLLGLDYKHMKLFESLHENIHIHINSELTTLSFSAWWKIVSYSIQQFSQATCAVDFFKLVYNEEYCFAKKRTKNLLKTSKQFYFHHWILVSQ